MTVKDTKECILQIFLVRSLEKIFIVIRNFLGTTNDVPELQIHKKAQCRAIRYIISGLPQEVWGRSVLLYQKTVRDTLYIIQAFF